MKVLMAWVAALVLVGGGFFAFGLDKKEETPAPPAKAEASKEPVKRAKVIKETLHVKDISPDMKGASVEIIGYVHDIAEGKGNVFATFKDVENDKYIKVVLFAKSIDKLPERKALMKKCMDNKKPLYVSGKVDIYKNELEVIAFKVYTK